MYEKARHSSLPWHLDEAIQPVQHLFCPRKADPYVRLNKGDAAVFFSFCPQFTSAPP
jgi:hypothetical protein